MTTPARPDLDAIKARMAWPNNHRTVLLHIEERDALVAWIEHLESEIAALETRLPDVISVKRRSR